MCVYVSSGSDILGISMKYDYEAEEILCIYRNKNEIICQYIYGEKVRLVKMTTSITYCRFLFFLFHYLIFIV